MSPAAGHTSPKRGDGLPSPAFRGGLSNLPPNPFYFLTFSRGAESLKKPKGAESVRLPRRAPGKAIGIGNRSFPQAPCLGSYKPVSHKEGTPRQREFFLTE
jgi:hypothetical protein